MPYKVEVKITITNDPNSHDTYEEKLKTMFRWYDSLEDAQVSASDLIESAHDFGLYIMP